MLAQVVVSQIKASKSKLDAFERCCVEWTSKSPGKKRYLKQTDGLGGL